MNKKILAFLPVGLLLTGCIGGAAPLDAATLAQGIEAIETAQTAPSFNAGNKATVESWGYTSRTLNGETKIDEQTSITAFNGDTGYFHVKNYQGETWSYVDGQTYYLVANTPAQGKKYGKLDCGNAQAANITALTMFETMLGNPEEIVTQVAVGGEYFYMLELMAAIAEDPETAGGEYVSYSDVALTGSVNGTTIDATLNATISSTDEDNQFTQIGKQTIKYTDAKFVYAYSEISYTDESSGSPITILEKSEIKVSYSCTQEIPSLAGYTEIPLY